MQLMEVSNEITYRLQPDSASWKQKGAKEYSAFMGSLLARKADEPRNTAVISVGEGGPCDNIVSVTSSWSGGYTTALKVLIKTSITSWKMDITFSSVLSNFQ
ncbi:endoglucase-1 [Daphnia sinensis]|uniref:Endoglucase-1 n=1 Tax=Daphnia sinensis TaxID=1820382 RepID=A0AAD5KWI2_9CRUS|nr:endoglucase-1 [Daphnia sinensis]